MLKALVQFGFVAVMVAAAAIAAVPGRGDEPPARVAVEEPERLDIRGLPNAVRVHPRVISGGRPSGDTAFENLSALGVTTVISVDGAAPEVETARRAGLRYIHLPHGYDGIDPQRLQELAKAVRDAPGPVYIHCHHGKHRSPAAAAAACVTADLIPPEWVDAILETGGVGKNYVGLLAAARRARPVSPESLDAIDPEFPEAAELPGTAEAMVRLEEHWDNLRLLAGNRWRAPEDHPDMTPAHEALLFRESYTELLRHPDLRRYPPEMTQSMKQSERRARALEAHLEAYRDGASGGDSPEVLMKAIENDCAACHRVYRDVPATR